MTVRTVQARCVKKHKHLTYALEILALVLSTGAGAQELVTEVWVHDVPGPPTGDFWDSALASAFGLFAGKAGVYPDVMVCMRPFPGGIRSCTSVCVDLQGDTTLGGSGKSTACRRPLRVTLPATDRRMQIEVLEMDNVDSSPRVHAVIAQVGVTDPATCPHEKPCKIDTPKGALVLSFSTRSRTGAAANVGSAGQMATSAQTAAANDAAAITQMDATPQTGTGTLATRTAQTTPTTQTDAAAASPPPGCVPPSRRWTNPDSGLHGPYPTAHDAMWYGGAGRIAFDKIREKTFYTQAEWGFVIVRDRRDPTKYYTTPPVPSSVPWSLSEPPKMQWTDYIASLGKAFDGSCARIRDFLIAANAHVHPYPGVWGLEDTIDNFSMADFSQAVQIKNKYGFSASGPYENVLIGSTGYMVKTQDLVPDLEAIYMINERDSRIYLFVPRLGDPEIKPDHIVSDPVRVRANAEWRQYGLPENNRVTIDGLY